jgi:hypothetical protein
MIRESRQELAVTEAPLGPECDQALAVEIGATRADWQSKEMVLSVWSMSKETVVPGSFCLIRRHLASLRLSDQYLPGPAIQRVVQRFTVVDNSDFSPTRLTAVETLLILPDTGALHAPHFKQ